MANRRVGTHVLTSDNLRRSRLNSMMVPDVPGMFAANTRQLVMVSHVLGSIAANEFLQRVLTAMKRTCKDGYGTFLEGSVASSPQTMTCKGSAQQTSFEISSFETASGRPHACTHAKMATARFSSSSVAPSPQGPSPQGPMRTAVGHG